MPFHVWWRTENIFRPLLYNTLYKEASMSDKNIPTFYKKVS